MSAQPLTPRILAGLKDFQRDTVEYVFEQLYREEKPAHRFLVADEVGLGKTLVARGIVAKVIDRLRSQDVKRIDIVYICSNGDIAQQNIRKVNVTGDSNQDRATRITLVPVELRHLKSQEVNFISLTPGTSFQVGGGSGRREERLLLYWLLRYAWGATGLRHAGVFRLLRGSVGEARFREDIRGYPHRRVGNGKDDIDEDVAKIFRDRLEEAESAARAAGRPTIRERINDIAHQLRRRDKQHLGPERDRLVGELRGILARSCIDSLEPDLIILDEFQRFRELLDEPAGDADEARTLAHQLFNYESKDGRARTLLLSATPYKMYTLADEQADDHYADFTRTTDFLLDKEETTVFHRELSDYRQALTDLHDPSSRVIRRRRRAVEKRLRTVMVRTERLGVTRDRSGMLGLGLSAGTEVTADDIRTYVVFDEVARRLKAADSMEYWKSAPYPLSFMQLGYDVKRRIRDADPATKSELAILLESRQGLIDPDQVAAYGRLEPGGGRLRSLHDQMVDSGAWRLLWIPPSLPYYRPRGAFAVAARAGFTKRLVFSAWAVVPQAVASLLSYEAERQMMLARSRNAENTREAREKQRSLLQFRRTKDGAASMSTFSLVYPSRELSRLVDPLSLGAELRGSGSVPSAAAILREATGRVREALAPVIGSIDHSTDTPDENWYWAAPLLLDRYAEGDDAERFLWRPDSDLLRAWIGTSNKRVEEHGAFAAHLARARDVASSPSQLGRPPRDLAETVALIGLAGPANVALRSLSRGIDHTAADQAIRDAACRVAWGFRSLFSPPEVMALIRGKSGSQKAYWRKVLNYAFDGDLQSAMDEYTHLLMEWLGLMDRPPAERAKEIGEEIFGVTSIRAALYGYDPMDLLRAGGEERSFEFRGRFALRFGVDSTDEDRALQRSSQVRSAFNSPFWPFVLVTTSVGQEGLDFHQYCHAVTHWNLPANPVDLEQREGRVHRYKGHAVRRNVASAHGRAVLAKRSDDPWAALFEAARSSPKARGRNELVPYWIYEGRHKIERYIPSLPLSREQDRLDQLLKSLAVYRLAFGQPRQEDLVALLRARMSEREIQRAVQTLRIDLSPPRSRPAP